MSSRFLPNTQGPRWAFKIPFITMEPSRLKSQAGGLGLVSGVACWVGGESGFGVVLFFCFKLVLFFFFKKNKNEKLEAGRRGLLSPPAP